MAMGEAASAHARADRAFSNPSRRDFEAESPPGLLALLALEFEPRVGEPPPESVLLSPTRE